jgi:hypothetical protein
MKKAIENYTFFEHLLPFHIRCRHFHLRSSQNNSICIFVEAEIKYGRWQSPNERLSYQVDIYTDMPMEYLTRFSLKLKNMTSHY